MKRVLLGAAILLLTGCGQGPVTMAPTETVSCPSLTIPVLYNEVQSQCTRTCRKGHWTGVVKIQPEVILCQCRMQEEEGEEHENRQAHR